MITFLPEQIELLWIIPVIALVIFIFVIQLVAQKHEESDLTREVDRFNTGLSTFPGNSNQIQGADRLNQLEKAISKITESLSTQQHTLNKFNKDSLGHGSEINDLKTKLRELYKEYDMVLSENYSLKAKVKKLQDNDLVDTTRMRNPVIPYSSDNSNAMLSSKMDMKLYEDTRTLNISLLEDTSEMDISDFPKRSS